LDISARYRSLRIAMESSKSDTDRIKLRHSTVIVLLAHARSRFIEALEIDALSRY